MSKNLSAKYYHGNIEKLQEKVLKKYQKKKKKKKQQYGCKHYKNLPEDEKQKLVVYRKKYYRIRKNDLL